MGRTSERHEREDCRVTHFKFKDSELCLYSAGLRIYPLAIQNEPDTTVLQFPDASDSVYCNPNTIIRIGLSWKHMSSRLASLRVEC